MARDKQPGRPSQPTPEQRYREQLDAAKRASLGQALLRAARLLDEQALARVRALPGAPSLRPAHSRVFPHLDLEGTRLTELARRLQVSKQAAGQVVDELREMGIVELAPDPDDGRAKRVRFTPLGRRGLLHGLQVLGEIESEIAAVMGKRDVQTLRALLARALAILETRAPHSPGSVAKPDDSP